ncbi:MAG: DUF3276 family protein [Chlorobi bacterium]|nr:DUF3276 family protein [Chlorobiota bacterium]
MPNIHERGYHFGTFNMQKRRPTLFSRTVHTGKRSYFVDVEQVRTGERIVFLIESHGKHQTRYRVLILEEDLPRLVEALDAAAQFLAAQPNRPPKR